MSGNRPLIFLWFAACAAAWLLAHPLLGGPGLTWDEAYYYPTFRDVAAWASAGAPLSAEGIVAGWQRIHELPPLLKWLGAAASSLPASGWWHLAWLRLVPAASFATALVLVALIARRCGAGPWAWLAAATYAGMPRVLGHAQIAATESLVASVALFVTWCALQDLRAWKWRVALAGALGLALATKVNGLILLAAIAWWLATAPLFDPRRRRSARAHAATLAGILLAAPLVALAIWPWMWHDTAARIAEYARFIREHSHQGVWWLGTKWNFGGPPAPAPYPVAMIHLVVPVATLAMAWAGIGAGIRRLAVAKKMRAAHYLVALLFLAPLAAASLPSAPKYDGERLFFPAFAPMAILAALGLRMIAAKRPRLRGMRPALIALALLPLLAGRPSVDSWNALAKLWPANVRIAAGRAIPAFEQTYWINALNAKAAAELNALLPPGARVKTLAIQGEAFPILQQWGVLRSDIAFDGPPPYDAHLLQNRRGFWSRTEWHFFLERVPIAAWGKGLGGEPLLLLYDGAPPSY